MQRRGLGVGYGGWTGRKSRSGWGGAFLQECQQASAWAAGAVAAVEAKSQLDYRERASKPT